MKRRRRVLALDGVATAALDAAAIAWDAHEAGGTLHESEALVILFDPLRTPAVRFVDTLALASEAQCVVGVLPLYGPDADRVDPMRLLRERTMHLRFERCVLRLHGNASIYANGVPQILRRALDDDPQAVAEDLAQADFLLLQGHSGPIDGSFGRSLTLCGRELASPNATSFFPCVGTGRCFRQASQNRPETSWEGLIDPRSLRSALVLVDGCGTLPVPGSIYSYDQSLLRGIMFSRVRASVLSLGVSATPLSAIVLLMGLLASGHSLGMAVRRTNLLRAGSSSPSSTSSPGAAPWVLIGNPETVVTGLPLISLVKGDYASPESDRFEVAPPPSAGQTGMLVTFDSGQQEAALEVTSQSGVWVHGARERSGKVFLWLGTAVNDVEPSGNTRLELRIAPRPAWRCDDWRESLLWLDAGALWLDGIAQALKRRGLGTEQLETLILLRHEVARSLEPAVWAAAPLHCTEIVGGVSQAAERLVQLLESLDAATVSKLARAIPFAGARLSHLWTPAWHHEPGARLHLKCQCGCMLVGHARKHPLNLIRRVEISCPACSLVGDVAGNATQSLERTTVEPAMLASVHARTFAAGERLRWQIWRLAASRFRGFACATLFDPFRERQVFSEPITIGSDGNGALDIEVPADWPAGLAWTTIVMADGGRLSMFAYDVAVQAPRGASLPGGARA